MMEDLPAAKVNSVQILVKNPGQNISLFFIPFQ